MESRKKFKKALLFSSFTTGLNFRPCRKHGFYMRRANELCSLFSFDEFRMCETFRCLRRSVLCRFIKMVEFAIRIHYRFRITLYGYSAVAMLNYWRIFPLTALRIC